ncbi:hypothetical protein [Ancylobacter polymorphus]|uniref:Uncharacterized protein n=1 Tax=Ancylobacter polymorphus TaxID=223390 RepID=A0A9E7D314_9HYPH|nr:hypothetical protein [Ancylobacter polymorphus]UOK70432.1 hypothetical protein K9D25_17120 [Ancylobacter polymorphus]
MRLLAVRPSPPGTPLLGFVDVELGPVRLFGVEIRRATDGTLRAWPPKRGERRSAAIDPATAFEIATAAMAALGGPGPHVHQR